MWKAALAGAFALATIGSSLASAQTFSPEAPRMQLASAQVGEVESGLAQLKSALQLRADQERHWPSVAAAIRNFVRQRATAAEGTESDGFVRRVRNRAGSLAMGAASLKRLISAAQPLIKTLDPDQKRQAVTVARNMGFDDVAAYLQ